jgi:Overcoming lysogenization defect protein-like, TOPRIM domain/AAA domain, putative AbiEii toxin, Type IV TA system
MVRLGKLKISNIYSYGPLSSGAEDQNTVNLTDTNVIVGPNDSGKSNVFRAVGLLKDVLSTNVMLDESDVFSGNANPKLEATFQLSDDEASLLLEFLSVYVLRTPNNLETTFVHVYKNRSKVLKSLKNLRIEVIWQPTNNASLWPLLIVNVDDLGIKIQTNSPQGPSFITPSFPFSGAVQAHEKFPEFIDSLASEDGPEVEAAKLRDSTGWQFTISQIPSNTLANPVPDRAFIDRLLAFAGIRAGSGYGLTFSQTIAAILSRASFISTGGTIFHRRAVQLEQSTDPSKTVAQDILDSTRYSAALEPDGWNLAEFLYNLKNSYLAEERERFSRIQRAFSELLTHLSFDVVLQPLKMRRFVQAAGGQEGDFRYPHVVVKDARNSKQFLLEKVGAGISESLFLLTILIGLRDCMVLLDEPAVNLHPAQMKALFRIANQPTNQLVVITHSPVLLNGLLFDRGASIIHIQRSGDRSFVTGLDTSEIWSGRERYRLSYQLDTRIFFARHVLLGEGESDRELFETTAESSGLEPDVHEDVVIDAKGKNNLSKYSKLLEHFAIPYKVVADGDGQDQSELGNRAMSYAGTGGFAIIDSAGIGDFASQKVFFFKNDVEGFLREKAPELYNQVEVVLKKREGTFAKPLFIHEIVPRLQKEDPSILGNTIKRVLDSAFEVQARGPIAAVL